MNKKGFTLTELLAVIVILAIITIVAAASISGVMGNAKKNMLEDKKMNIETAAINYIQNNNIELNSADCTPIGSNYDRCKTLTVQELLNAKELESKDRNNKFYNDVTGKDMANDKVTVYRMNNRLYAKITCMISNDEKCNV